MDSETMNNTNTEVTTVVPGGEEMTVKKEMTVKTVSFHTGVKQYTMKLVYWEDVLQSAMVMSGGSMLYLITHVMEYPALSLGAYVLMMFILLSAGAKFASVVMDKLGMTPHPLLAKLQAGVPSPVMEEEAVVARTKEALAMANMGAAQFNEVLAFSDMKMSAKVVGGLYCAARLFQLVSLTTLVFMVFFLGMSAPKIYMDNKVVIDETALKAMNEAKARGEELKAKSLVMRDEMSVKAMAAFEDGKVKMAEMRDVAHAKLVEAIAALPPNVSETVKPYLPASLVAVEKTEKLD